MTIGQINQMPMSEYMSWQQYYLIEPWGLRPQDAMHAHLAVILANANRNTEVRPDPYELKDFLLYAPEVEPKEEPRIDGKTCAEWKLIFAAEALQASRTISEKATS